MNRISLILQFWCWFTICAFTFTFGLSIDYSIYVKSNLSPIRRVIIAATSTMGSFEWQRLIAVCIGCYFVILTVLKRLKAWRSESTGECVREVAILLLLLSATIPYASSYKIAFQSADYLVLLTGAMIGKVVALLQVWLREPDSVNVFHLAALSSLSTALVAVAVVHPEFEISFEYRSQQRWSGPFLNPNTFGLLMGVGVVLAISQTLNNGAIKTQRIKRPTYGWKSSTNFLFYITATGVLLFGLIQSYSRGAWVATLIGIVYLFTENCVSLHECCRIVLPKSIFYVGHRIHLFLFKRSIISFRTIHLSSRRRLGTIPVRCWMIVLLFSLITLLFWDVQYTEYRLMRRLLSFSTFNDFSASNRAITGVGALQMMAESPLFGFGWNMSESAYSSFYRISILLDRTALRTNSYAVIGTTIGLFPLGCFFIYIWLSFKNKFSSDRYRNPVSEAFSTELIDDDCSSCCRACIVVFLVGFFFDGGLFRLTTGAIFWALLEIAAYSRPMPLVKKTVSF